MSTEDQEICCHVTPLDIVDPEDESFSCPMVSIDVVATFMHPPMEEADGDESNLYDAECDMVQHEFLVERERLIHQETSMSTINQILTDINVPVQSYMLHRILGVAHQMASNKRYQDRNVLRMKVEIDVPPALVDAMDDDDGVDGDDEDESAIRFVPASKSSMENLEKIKVQGSNKQLCTICLEEFLMGSEATRLPCLHVYHSECIVNWLENSRACPLCRFEIA